MGPGPRDWASLQAMRSPSGPGPHPRQAVDWAPCPAAESHLKCELEDRPQRAGWAGQVVPGCGRCQYQTQISPHLQRGAPSRKWTHRPIWTSEIPGTCGETSAHPPQESSFHGREARPRGETVPGSWAGSWQGLRELEVRVCGLGEQALLP